MTVVTSRGDTALHLAAGEGYHMVLEQLLIAGAHTGQSSGESGMIGDWSIETYVVHTGQCVGV